MTKGILGTKESNALNQLQGNLYWLPFFLLYLYKNMEQELHYTKSGVFILTPSLPVTNTNHKTQIVVKNHENQFAKLLRFLKKEDTEIYFLGEKKSIYSTFYLFSDNEKRTYAILKNGYFCASATQNSSGMLCYTNNKDDVINIYLDFSQINIFPVLTKESNTPNWNLYTLFANNNRFLMDKVEYLFPNTFAGGRVCQGDDAHRDAIVSHLEKTHILRFGMDENNYIATPREAQSETEYSFVETLAFIDFYCKSNFNADLSTSLSNYLLSCLSCASNVQYDPSETKPKEEIYTVDEEHVPTLRNLAAYVVQSGRSITTHNLKFFQGFREDQPKEARSTLSWMVNKIIEGALIRKPKERRTKVSVDFVKHWNIFGIANTENLPVHLKEVSDYKNTSFIRELNTRYKLVVQHSKAPELNPEKEAPIVKIMKELCNYSDETRKRLSASKPDNVSLNKVVKLANGNSAPCDINFKFATNTNQQIVDKDPNRSAQAYIQEASTFAKDSNVNYVFVEDTKEHMEALYKSFNMVEKVPFAFLADFIEEINKDFYLKLKNTQSSTYSPRKINTADKNGRIFVSSAAKDVTVSTTVHQSDTLFLFSNLFFKFNEELFAICSINEKEENLYYFLRVNRSEYGLGYYENIYLPSSIVVDREEQIMLLNACLNNSIQVQTIRRDIDKYTDYYRLAKGVITELSRLIDFSEPQEDEESNDYAIVFSSEKKYVGITFRQLKTHDLESLGQGIASFCADEYFFTKNNLAQAKSFIFNKRETKFSVPEYIAASRDKNLYKYLLNIHIRKIYLSEEQGGLRVRSREAFETLKAIFDDSLAFDQVPGSEYPYIVTTRSKIQFTRRALSLANFKALASPNGNGLYNFRYTLDEFYGVTDVFNFSEAHVDAYLASVAQAWNHDDYQKMAGGFFSMCYYKYGYFKQTASKCDAKDIYSCLEDNLEHILDPEHNDEIARYLAPMVVAIPVSQPSYELYNTSKTNHLLRYFETIEERFLDAVKPSLGANRTFYHLAYFYDMVLESLRSVLKDFLTSDYDNNLLEKVHTIYYSCMGTWHDASASDLSLKDYALAKSLVSKGICLLTTMTAEILGLEFNFDKELISRIDEIIELYKSKNTFKEIGFHSHGKHKSASEFLTREDFTATLINLENRVGTDAVKSELWEQIPHDPKREEKFLFDIMSIYAANVPGLSTQDPGVTAKTQMAIIFLKTILHGLKTNSFENTLFAESLSLPSSLEEKQKSIRYLNLIISLAKGWNKVPYPYEDKEMDFALNCKNDYDFYGEILHLGGFFDYWSLPFFVKQTGFSYQVSVLDFITKYFLRDNSFYFHETDEGEIYYFPCPRSLSCLKFISTTIKRRLFTNNSIYFMYLTPFPAIPTENPEEMLEGTLSYSDHKAYLNKALYRSAQYTVNPLRDGEEHRRYSLSEVEEILMTFLQKIALIYFYLLETGFKKEAYSFLQSFGAEFSIGWYGTYLRNTMHMGFSTTENTTSFGVVTAKLNYLIKNHPSCKLVDKASLYNFWVPNGDFHNEVNIFHGITETDKKKASFNIGAWWEGELNAQPVGIPCILYSMLNAVNLKQANNFLKVWQEYQTLDEINLITKMHLTTAEAIILVTNEVVEVNSGALTQSIRNIQLKYKYLSNKDKLEEKPNFISNCIAKMVAEDKYNLSSTFLVFKDNIIAATQQFYTYSYVFGYIDDTGLLVYENYSKAQAVISERDGINLVTPPEEPPMVMTDEFLPLPLDGTLNTSGTRTTNDIVVVYPPGYVIPTTENTEPLGSPIDEEDEESEDNDWGDWDDDNEEDEQNFF